MGKFNLTFMDHDSESSGCGVPIVDLNAGNITAQLALLATLEAAIDDVVRGTKTKRQVIAETEDLGGVAPASGDAQREDKWFVAGVDALGNNCSLEIPTALRTLLPAGSGVLDISAGEGLALADALNDVWVSKHGSAVTVSKVTSVSPEHLSKNAWLTVDDIPEARTTRTITLPDGEPWVAILRGALSPLIDEANFEQFGTLTPAEMAEEWFRIFIDFLEDPPMLIPPGLISPFAGSTPPAGWLLCDGAAVSRTTYADLFAVVDLTYGFGDGSTTFNIPDLRARVVAGRDASQAEFTYLGQFDGEIDHTLLTSEMPSHGHVQDSHNHTQNSHGHVQDSHNHTQNSHGHVQDGHNHTQNPHAHNFNSRTGGALTVYGPDATTIGQVQISIIPAATATNQATTATNQSTTPTNQATTATNQSTTPTNQAATATNQNAGGGGVHNNLQPYLVVNYIIKT